MLEKSRVTLEFPHERNFLIFYYLLAGLDDNTLETLQLTDIQKHRITKLPEGLSNYQSKQWNETFQELKRTMLMFGFNEEVRIY